MSHRFAMFLSISICLLGCVAFLTGDQPITVTATEPTIMATGDLSELVSSTAYGVFDVSTGRLLLSENEDKILPIASVTKLFSGAMILANDDLDTTVTINEADVMTEGRAGKLSAGETYTKREMLWPLLLESSNDAAAALERSESGLVDAMNTFADGQRALHTTFTDASGLSSHNVSTVIDLAEMARGLFLDQPHLFDISQHPQYITETNGWINNSPVVGEENYRGGRYTPEANRTGVFIFDESIPGDGKRPIGYVLLGSDDLKNDVRSLRSWVQKNVTFQ